MVRGGTGPRVPPRRWLRHGPHRVRRGRPRRLYLSGGDVRQNGQGSGPDRGSQPVTSAHLPNANGVVGDRRTIAWGNGPNSTDRVRRPDRQGRVRDVPQPARQRRSTGSSTRSRTPRRRSPTSSSRPRPPRPSPTRRSRPPATPATTPSSRPTAAPARSSRARSPPSTCRPRRATTGAGRCRGTARRGTSNDAPNGQSATFYQPDLRVVPDVPHALPERGLGRRRPRTRSTSIGTPSNASSRNCITCHVAHGSNAQMTGFNSATMDYPGGIGRTGRRQPAPEDRQPWHLPGLSRSDGDDHRRDSRSGRRRPRSSPSSDNLRGGRRQRPGHPQQPSTG